MSTFTAMSAIDFAPCGAYVNGLHQTTGRIQICFISASPQLPAPTTPGSLELVNAECVKMI
jgi:hypothetical protein